MSGIQMLINNNKIIKAKGQNTEQSRERKRCVFILLTQMENNHDENLEFGLSATFRTQIRVQFIVDTVLHKFKMRICV